MSPRFLWFQRTLSPTMNVHPSALDANRCDRAGVQGAPTLAMRAEKNVTILPGRAAKEATMIMRQDASAAASSDAAGSGRAGAPLDAPPRRRQPQQDPWPSLAAQIFDGRAIQDGGAVVAIDAPYRAEDAALVPIGIRSLLPSGDPRRIRRYHACDRREPVAAGRRVLTRRRQRDAVAVHQGPRRFLHQPACRGGTERRAALRGAAVRQGGRRLLGSRREAAGGLRPASARCASDSFPLRPVPTIRRTARHSS